MSKDKYPSIFSSQMVTIVFIILQIFFVTRAILKIGEYLTIILRNRAEYRLILSRRGRRPSRLKSDDIPRAGGAGSPSHDTARQSSGEFSQM